MTPPLSVVPNPPPQVVEAEAPAQLETAVSVRNLPLGVLAILASIVMLRWAAPVLVPMMLALTTSYALGPLVDRMQRWGLPRALAAALVLGALVSVLGVSIYRLRDDATTVIESLPQATQKLRMALRKERASAASPLDKVQEACLLYTSPSPRD